ncbi:secretin N-terminal domain-containing protein [Lentisphaerota bacterium ZTH]|nr:hypothetical protein JYG24_07190 [Lentisphaerota bacterium]WET06721.1 secretin N-terminal domain-containing protein [Lentisphaerota bacterium ZTH]
MKIAKNKRNMIPFAALALCSCLLSSCSLFQPPQEKKKITEDPPVIVAMKKNGKNIVKRVTDDTIGVDEVKPFHFENSNAGIEKTEEGDVVAPLSSKQFFDRFVSGLKDGGKSLKVTIDFDQADIRDVIPAFAKVLGFEYIIAPTVSGSVTLSIDSKLTKAEIWKVFDQVLNMAGAYCSPIGKSIKILPLGDMAKDSNISLSGLSNAQAAVIPLLHTGAKDIADALKNFVSEGGTIQALPSQTAIMVVDTSANILKIRNLVKILDRNQKKGWYRAVIPCHNVSAKRIEDELENILPVLGFPVQVEKEFEGSKAVHVIGVERLSVIVAAAASKEAIREVGNWVKQLDRNDVGDQERVFIYKVINGKADELTTALSVIFNVAGETIKPDTSNSADSYGSGSSFSNSLDSQSSSSSSSTSSSGSSSSFSDLMKSGGGNKGIKTKSSKIESKRAQDSSKEKQKESVSVFDVPTKIFADAVQNRLIIRTKPRTYALMKALLERLDTIPPQVLLQVLVVELTLTKSTEFGVEFSDINLGGKYGQHIGTEYKDLNKKNTDQYGFKYWVTNPNNPKEKFAYLRALAGHGNVRVISSPQILVQSHAQAKISVGDKIPLISSEITNTQSQTPDDTSLRRSIQYQDTGIILTLTPHVTQGNMINLDLEQVVSQAIKTTSSSIDSPTIQERVLRTTMGLENRQALIIGGLIREREERQLDSIPFLIDIPFISRLVGNTNNTKERTEMLVLVQGEIINRHTNLEKVLKRYKNAVQTIREFEYKNVNGDPDEKKKKTEL